MKTGNTSTRNLLKELDNLKEVLSDGPEHQQDIETGDSSSSEQNPTPPRQLSILDDDRVDEE